MHLRLLPEPFAILKWIPPQTFPAWLERASLFFLASAEDEYSIMCPQRCIPDGFAYLGGYRCLRVESVAFDEVGVVARASGPLAAAGLSLFLISTHDRDYILIHEHDLAAARTAYQAAGLEVIV